MWKVDALGKPAELKKKVKTLISSMMWIVRGGHVGCLFDLDFCQLFLSTKNHLYNK